MRTTFQIITGVGMLAAAGGMVAVGVLRSAPATIEALAAPEVVQLGEAIRGDVVEFAFEVRNTSGDAPLRVEDITSSCACTTLQEGEAFTLAPGASKRLSGVISLSTLGYGETGGAMLFLTDAAGEERRVRLRATFVDAFPAGAAPNEGGELFLPLDERYREAVETVTVYPHLSDTPLKSAFTPDRSALIVRLREDDAADLTSVDAVMSVRGDSGGVYRVSQEIELTREGEEPVAGAAGG